MAAALSLRGTRNGPEDRLVAAASFPERQWYVGSAVGRHLAAELTDPRARGWVMSQLLLNRAGRRRSPATMAGFHAGRPPRNKGLRYPADPPKVEEIIAVVLGAR
jgi:hypothetical protein